MNKTNLQHAAWALLFQAITAWATGSWIAGAFVGVAFFLGREHAQRQYHLARDQMTTVAKLKPWEGFDLADWPTDSKLDLFAPVAACALAALLEHIVQPML